MSWMNSNAQSYGLQQFADLSVSWPQPDQRPSRSDRRLACCCLESDVRRYRPSLECCDAPFVPSHIAETRPAEAARTRMCGAGHGSAHGVNPLSAVMARTRDFGNCAVPM